MAIGLASFLLIMLYVQDELSYDRFHNKADQIYRVVTETSVVEPGPLAAILTDKFPEFKDVTRLYSSNVWGRSALVSHENNHFYTNGFFMVDQNFLDIFTFPLIRGDLGRALSDVTSIVLTEEMAKKYFGDKNPIGEVLVYENQFEFKVSGILQNIPGNSHMQFDFLVPLENYEVIREAPNGLNQWFNSAFITYALIENMGDRQELEEKISTGVKDQSGEKFDRKLSLQPIQDIHLRSNLRREISANSNIRSVYIFSVIAVLILLIACINFMNLTTARSITRAKEIGLRKVIGANRIQLIRQFIGEAVLMIMIAVLAGLLLVILALPEFNNLAGKEILLQSENFIFYAFLLGLVILGVGLLSGSYPAFYLSAFSPADVIRGKSEIKKKSGLSLRSILVVLQFAISIGLIASTAIIYQQMQFMHNKNLGFSKDQVVIIPSRRSEEVVNKIITLKNEISKHSSVNQSTISSQIPGHNLFRRGIRVKGDPSEKYHSVNSLWVDHEFIKTYQVELAAGRDFSVEISTDATSAFILNETAIKMLDWANPTDALGRQIESNGKEGKVIGVAKDFHFMSLHSKIQPTVMHIVPSRFYDLSVRIETSDITSTLSYFESIWKSLFPNRPFEYYFLDAEYGMQYRTDERMARLLGIFSGLAILIACLGLFGLTVFIAERRTREIGIRKVLGATIPNVMMLISKDFMKLVIIANIIAWPITIYFMNEWLKDFAYRINIEWITFPLSGLFALVIALVTVSYHAGRSAMINPIESLRHE